MSEDSDRDQVVGPDAQPQPSKGLESDLSHAHPAQTPTSLSCPPEVISLRMQWGSGRCWSLFTAEAQMKEGMITVSLAPASPSGVVSWIPPAQPHTPAPAKSPPSPTNTQVASKAPSARSGCPVAGTSLGWSQQHGPGGWWHKSWTCWASWDRESRAGSVEHPPNSPCRGINSIKEVIRKNTGSPSILPKLPRGCPSDLRHCRTGRGG